MATLLVLLLCLLAVATSQTPPKLPNIGYIGFGYNVFYGNPQSTVSFDPGFGQAPIFDFSYSKQQTTTDGKWLVPDNVAVPGMADECDVQGSSTVISYTYDYQSSLSVDVEASVSYEKASFSASSDYKKVDAQTSSNNNVFVSTSATCQTYLVDVNPYVHPNLSTVLVAQGSLLPTTFDPSNGSAFWEFFDLVGTHFATQMIFGSRWGYSFESTNSQWSTMQSIGLNVRVAASYAGMIKAGVSVNTSYAQQMAQNFTELTTSTNEYSLGVPPPSSGSSADWTAQSVSSSLMDPLQYSLTNISVLFTSEYSDITVLHERAQAVSDALNSYCILHLLKNGALDNCQGPPQPPPTPPPVGYGALACGSSNGKLECKSHFASVFDGTSNIQAQEVALDFCPSCSIVATVSNGGCIAMATASKGAFGVYWGTTNQTEMNENAVTLCEKYSSGETCEIVVSGCSAPPPVNDEWGAIACTSSCNSFKATSTGYPDRLLAHHVAMEGLVNSFVAIDFDQCAAIVKSSNGYAAAGGDTPQDATNAAMATCRDTMSDCVSLTYACITNSLTKSIPTAKFVGGSGSRAMLQATV